MMKGQLQLDMFMEEHSRNLLTEPYWEMQSNICRLKEQQPPPKQLTSLILKGG